MAGVVDGKIVFTLSSEDFLRGLYFLLTKNVATTTDRWKESTVHIMLGSTFCCFPNFWDFYSEVSEKLGYARDITLWDEEWEIVGEITQKYTNYRMFNPVNVSLLLLYPLKQLLKLNGIDTEVQYVIPNNANFYVPSGLADIWQKYLGVDNIGGVNITYTDSTGTLTLEIPAEVEFVARSINVYLYNTEVKDLVTLSVLSQFEEFVASGEVGYNYIAYNDAGNVGYDSLGILKPVLRGRVFIKPSGIDGNRVGVLSNESDVVGSNIYGDITQRFTVKGKGGWVIKFIEFSIPSNSKVKVLANINLPWAGNAYCYSKVMGFVDKYAYHGDKLKYYDPELYYSYNSTWANGGLFWLAPHHINSVAVDFTNTIEKTSIVTVNINNLPSSLWYEKARVVANLCTLNKSENIYDCIGEKLNEDGIPIFKEYTPNVNIGDDYIGENYRLIEIENCLARIDATYSYFYTQVYSWWKDVTRKNTVYSLPWFLTMAVGSLIKSFGVNGKTGINNVMTDLGRYKESKWDGWGKTYKAWLKLPPGETVDDVIKQGEWIGETMSGYESITVSEEVPSKEEKDITSATIEKFALSKAGFYGLSYAYFSPERNDLLLVMGTIGYKYTPCRGEYGKEVEIELDNLEV